MKRTFFKSIFTTLFLMTLPLMAQNNKEQFEKVEVEIEKLINLPDPTFNSNVTQEPMSAEAIADLGFEQPYKNTPRKFTMRDGKKLSSYTYERESKTTIVLLHGILSSAYLMNKTAGLLRDASTSQIIALDFRGHGQSEGAPGDVDYINQYVDDLVDVILTIKKEDPNQKIILAGHSMGGGIILRYAMKENKPPIDGYLLLAPHLGSNTPTIKVVNPENEDDSFIKLHINRIIGLKMMNAIGETKYNSLPVLFFNLPEAMPITTYSYRANESMYPLDYKKGLSAIDKPLLVIVGSEDEAFDASKFTSAITENSTGEVYVVENESHNGIRHNENTMNLVSKWVNNYQLH